MMLCSVAYFLANNDMSAAVPLMMMMMMMTPALPMSPTSFGGQ